MVKMQNIIESEWIKMIMYDPIYEKAREVLRSLPTIDRDTYIDIHYDPMIDLGIDIDLELFNQQVERSKAWFHPWGINDNKKNRYGVSLTDPTENYMAYPHPGCWPLDVWTGKHPNYPLFDSTLVDKNMWYDYFTALQPVYDVFSEHMARTNVTWWEKGGEFHTHIDCVVDQALNYRLWISNKTGDDHPLLFSNRDNTIDMINVSSTLKPGRLYLLDTSIYHNGRADVDDVFSMLMSVLPSATDTIKKLIGK